MNQSIYKKTNPVSSPVPKGPKCNTKGTQTLLCLRGFPVSMKSFKNLEILEHEGNIQENSKQVIFDDQNV